MGETLNKLELIMRDLFIVLFRNNGFNVARVKNIHCLFIYLFNALLEVC